MTSQVLCCAGPKGEGTMQQASSRHSILSSTVSACLAIAGSSSAPARAAAASCMQELITTPTTLSPAQVGWQCFPCSSDVNVQSVGDCRPSTSPCEEQQVHSWCTHAASGSVLP